MRSVASASVLHRIMSSSVYAVRYDRRRVVAANLFSAIVQNAHAHTLFGARARARSRPVTHTYTHVHTHTRPHIYNLTDVRRATRASVYTQRRRRRRRPRNIISRIRGQTLIRTYTQQQQSWPTMKKGKSVL